LHPEQFDWLVVVVLMKEEWRFSMMASGVQFVMTTGNCVVDKSSVEVWDTKVFEMCIRELILDKLENTNVEENRVIGKTEEEK
ncbi:hypothetical protein MC885_010796, partial [Smutsia gigantea]